MKKFMNFGLLTILGIIAALGPSRTKELKNDVDDTCKIEAMETQSSTLSNYTDKKIKVTNKKIIVTEISTPVTIINNIKL